MVGMAMEDGGKSGPVCGFTSKEALMHASLAAERFLSAHHIVAVAPVVSLSPVHDEGDGKLPE